MKNSTLTAIRMLIAIQELHAEQVNVKPIPKKMIAARVGYGTDYIEQLIKPLLDAGIVSAVRGVKGGFILKKPLRMIFMQDVIRLYEPQLDLSSMSSVEKAVRHLTLGQSAGTTLWKVRELSKGM